MSDYISREEAIKAFGRCADMDFPYVCEETPREILEAVKSTWIRVKDKLPDNNDAVIVTFVNRDPEQYYIKIKDVPFTAVAHCHKGKWWWFSATCQDYLNEYGRSPGDQVSKSIEIIAWMPMPEPYKEVSE